jgi:hypothetical protein
MRCHSVGFGYAEPNAVSNAIGYAKFFSRSHPAVLRVYDVTGNVTETHEYVGVFKECSFDFNENPELPSAACWTIICFPSWTKLFRIILVRCECAVRKTCHRRNGGRKKSSRAVDGVHLTFPANAR